MIFDFLLKIFKKKDDDDDERRTYLRVKYPKNHPRPTIKIEGKSFEVVDVSYSGLKFLSTEGFRPKRNAIGQAVILFQSGYAHQTKIKVVRVMGYFICVKFEIYIPKKELLKEDKLIATRMKTFRGD